MPVMVPALTIARASVETPDPVTLPRVRLLIRGGVATATDPTGRAVWTAHLAAARRVATDRWELDLVDDGGTANVRVLPCDCRGAR